MVELGDRMKENFLEDVEIPEDEKTHIELGNYALEVRDSLTDTDDWFTAHGELVSSEEQDAIVNVKEKIKELQDSLTELKRSTSRGASEKISDAAQEN